MSDFITTIDSDDEYDVPVQNGESSRGANGNGKGKGKGKSARVQIPDLEDDEGEGEMNGAASKGKKETKDLNPEFKFDGDGSRSDGLDLWGGDEVQEKGRGNEVINVDDIIARRTGKPLKAYRERKRKSQPEEDEEEDDSEDENADVNGDEDIDVDGEDDAGTDVNDLSDSGSEGFGAGAMDIDMSGESGSEGEEDEEDEEEDDEDDEEEEEDNDDSEDEPEETAAEKARKAAFFSSEPDASNKDDSLPTSFASMNLSRPLLRALTSLNFNSPTPIQSRAIPLALLGRDILGSAVTGSGKTAAFMVPILERLAYRDRGKGGAACRVLVLCPTRELAVQCEAVGKALAERGGLDVRFALLVGGLSLSAQAHTLRTLPDILIATPGRLIDHLTNTPSFTLSALDILVMDEADRMLEQGFTDELNEIIRACPRSRQTMLFSATMTDSVDELVKLSLDKPIRVFVDPKRSTASGLVQEFVRIRSDDSRTPALLALCKRTVHEKCIVFFRSKALAHQMRVVFGLLGMKAAELHGNLTQEQRLNALNDFKAGRVDYLLATDLASRGLDIKGVETVINYDMPGQLAQYTHRVGRTARAGRKGRSISLVGEPDRKMLKMALKQTASGSDTSGTVRHRVIPADAISGMSTKLEDLKEDVSEILKEEKEEKAMRQAEMEMKKGSNMIEHEAEIFGRPKREWFQSEKQKLAAKNLGKEGYVSKFPSAPAEPEKPKIKRGKYDGMSRRLKRRKMAMEADAEEGGIRDQGASIRAAKKSQRPVKITENQPNMAQAKGKKGAKKGGKKGGAVSEGAKGIRGGKKSAFDGPERAKKHEGMRAKHVKVNLDKKGKGGKGKGRK